MEVMEAEPMTNRKSKKKRIELGISCMLNTKVSSVLAVLRRPTADPTAAQFLSQEEKNSDTALVTHSNPQLDPTWPACGFRASEEAEGDCRNDSRSAAASVQEEPCPHGVPLQFAQDGHCCVRRRRLIPVGSIWRGGLGFSLTRQCGKD
ncbi:unnamed protein product [Linum trigynum]|uniref:Uncharacterized protein n=1 Tax=Linum trigynum TaxID=586398 RepID=A0AAV2GSR5_9ROSI